MEAWRAAVVEEAKTWLRTPWVHDQCVKGAGVDCGRLLKACFVGPGVVAEFEIEPYPMDWMLHREEEKYLGFVEAHMDRVETPLPGDIVVWKFGKCFSHGAIVVDWPVIIHAYRPERAVVWGDGTKGALAREHRRSGGAFVRECRFYSVAGRL